MENENVTPETENPEASAPTEKEPDTTVPESDIPEETVEHTPETVAAETEAEREDDRTVPYGALHEERQKRREEAQRRKELEEKWELANKRLEELQKRWEQPAVDFDFEPDFEDDPIEYMKHRIDSVAEKLTEREKAEQERLQQMEVSRQQETLVNEYRQAARSYAEKTPDFKDAYSHFTNTLGDTLTRLGYQPQDVSQIVANEEMALVQRAKALGENPAAMLYEAAQSMGYRPSRNTEGDDKIERLQKGQEAAKSLSSAGGSKKGELTLEALSDMTDEEFAAMSESDFRRVMGG